MAKRKSKAPAVPPGWVVSEEFSWNGRKIVKGTELSIIGQRGRFRFIRHVKTEKAEWIDVVGKSISRAFYPDKIKTVHRLTKLPPPR